METISPMLVLYTVPVLLVALLAFFALAGTWLQRQIPRDEQSLADRIEDMLPLTQCAQCGHPGCRPYAEAVADDAAIDLCPPGGDELVIALKDLMGSSAQLSETQTRDDPPALLAVIDEAACIGCTLCLDPCPVDAIVGAQGFMHTVIEAECTGCELCIAPCPVDCISLIEKPPVPLAEPVPLLGRGCINCGRCIDACPVALQPDQLLKVSNAADWIKADALQLQQCIECGLCDRVCPSEINLAARFTHAKRVAGALAVKEREKRRIKTRFASHQQRLITSQSDADSRRAERLARRASRQ